ncbi:MAG: alkaline phosphatase family protein, partial [Planctomycetaceae bacterium]|nr:alkaline phosphatase family protein [Planctomycetaceae bacterium]
MKKVLLVIVDALATRVVGPAIEAGELPNFRRLAEAGMFLPECWSIFPSITPAATCSLVTGGYPFEHGISGAYWYDTENDEVAYFGDDLLAIANEGVGNYINDFQVKLNQERLKAPTIFERIEKDSNLSDAVVNYLWYRGRFEQKVSTPLLLKLLPGVSLKETLTGPQKMYLGDFVATEIDGEAPTTSGGLTRRYGFHDETTAGYLLELAEKDALADFTLAYFPNNDFDSHSEGPENALATLQKVDEYFGTLLELRGGLENFLSDYAIVITGDHSQSDLDEAPAVDMNEVLADFQIVGAGAPWRKSEDLMVCPNMRAAQIYLRPDLWKRRQDVIDALLGSEDIDQVILCDNDGCFFFNDT